MKMRTKSKVTDIHWYYNRFSVTQRYLETKRLIQVQKTLRTKEEDRQTTQTHSHLFRQSYRKPDQRNFCYDISRKARGEKPLFKDFMSQKEKAV